MKKTFLTILISLSALAISTAPALAATTISFEPTAINATAGQNFNLAVAVNPSEKIYTTKIELNYPADLLEVKSFSLGSNWMALTQSGYDSIDNIGGTMIKTGGYPGGLASAANFGTISFSAKKAGSGTISLGTASLALNSQSQNVISGAPQATVSITAAVQPTPTPSLAIGTPRPTPTPTSTVSPSATPTGTPTPSPSESPLVIATPSPSPSPNATASLFAGLGNILSLGTGSAFLAIVVALIIILAIVYLVMYLVKRRKL